MSITVGQMVSVCGIPDVTWCVVHKSVSKDVQVVDGTAAFRQAGADTLVQSTADDQLYAVVRAEALSPVDG